MSEKSRIIVKLPFELTTGSLTLWRLRYNKKELSLREAENMGLIKYLCYEEVKLGEGRKTWLTFYEVLDNNIEFIRISTIPFAIPLPYMELTFDINILKASEDEVRKCMKV